MQVLWSPRSISTFLKKKISPCPLRNPSVCLLSPGFLHFLSASSHQLGVARTDPFAECLVAACSRLRTAASPPAEVQDAALALERISCLFPLHCTELEPAIVLSPRTLPWRHCASISPSTRFCQSILKVKFGPQSCEQSNKRSTV